MNIQYNLFFINIFNVKWNFFPSDACKYLGREINLLVDNYRLLEIWRQGYREQSLQIQISLKLVQYFSGHRSPEIQLRHESKDNSSSKCEKIYFSFFNYHMRKFCSLNLKPWVHTNQ
jgi:hypothetical protein